MNTPILPLLYRDTCTEWAPRLPEIEWPSDVSSNRSSVEDAIWAQVLIAKTAVQKQPPSAPSYILGVGNPSGLSASYYSVPYLDQSFFPFSTERTAQQQLIETFTALYQCGTRLHLRVAKRLIALYRDAIAEDEIVLAASIKQLGDFFLGNPNVSLPKITATPNHTLRARWIRGVGNFTAIEFTGTPMAKLVAEIPRGNGSIAQYFGSEPIETIALFARALGAEFS
jgi:hypothetical protein